MKLPDLSDILRKVAGFIPRVNVEKIVFRILLGAWLFVIAGIFVFGLASGAREDMERKITEAATNVRYSRRDISEAEKYEVLLNMAKYPEKIERYTSLIRRDPFSEYKETAVVPEYVTGHDFVLKDIERVPLPLVYKGYIELPDRVIGQMNWRDSTRFVQAGTALNGYRIQKVSQDKVEALDEDGRTVVFELNKPLLSDSLGAVLYDNITGKTFNVELLSEIDDYKVIDIAPNYVILLTKGEEIRLEK